MNFLDSQQVRNFLTRKKTIEHWIGKDVVNNFETFKWISIEVRREEPGKYYVLMHHVFNESAEGIDSLYDYCYVVPDDMDGKIIGEFRSYEEALEFSVEHFGVDMNRFFPEGYIDDMVDYLSTLSQNNPKI
ncbi:MAG: hypothetical protein QNK23_14260 [Crocinitomicaceae bacterium]|nr:hypothetical protein [Crocinitomicaceae bacterium]